MDLFSKINNRIDYSDFYSVRKAFSTLNNEFNNACKNNNAKYAKYIILVAKKIQDNWLSLNKNKNIASQIQNFINYFNLKFYKEF